MNLTKASIVAMSHLSDAEFCTGNDPHKANRHIEFAKYIINKTKGDLNTEIDPDALWEEFAKRWDLNNKKSC